MPCVADYTACQTGYKGKGFKNVSSPVIYSELVCLSKFVSQAVAYSSPSISAMWENINKYSNDGQIKDPWMTACLFSTAFQCKVQ